MPGAQGDVAVRRGDGVEDVHILAGVEQDAAVRRGDRRIDVYVATATGHEIAVGGGDRGVYVDVAVGVERQGRRAGRRGPADGVIDVNVAIAREIGARPGHGADHDIGGHQLGGQGRSGDIAAGADGEVRRIDQPGAGDAPWRFGGDASSGRDVHGPGGSVDEPAVAPVGRAGVEDAAHADRAARHVAQQDDRASAIADRAGLDHAGVVDRGPEQLARALGGHQYPSAVGLQHAAVLDQGVGRAPVDDHIQQAVAGHVEGYCFARDKGDGAEVGLDQALVADVGPQQGDIAPVRDDPALVHHGAAAGAREPVVTGHEVRVGHIQGGGHEPADVDLRSLTEQDAVGIDQEHLAVGRQAAEDRRGVRSEDPVERDGPAIGLHEDDAAAATDREALPVDRRVLGRLVDGDVARPGCNGRATTRDRPAGGKGLSLGRRPEGKRRRQSSGGEADEGC